MQLVPPTAVSVSVIDPGAHVAQATVAMALYCPAAQLVQLVPPAAVRVSVIEPGAHVAQLESPDGLYWPAGHSLQCAAPVDTPDPSVSELELAVKWPAEQEMQPACPPLAWYWPVGQEMQDPAPAPLY